MGYVTKDIAIITEPDIVSLSGVPNFTIFASKPSERTLIDVNIEVVYNINDSEDITDIIFTIPSFEPVTFRGTRNPNLVTSTVFYLDDDRSQTAANLQRVILNNDILSSAFEVTIPFVWQGGTPHNGHIIHIRGKSAGDSYDLTIGKPNDPDDNAYIITWINADSHNGDSISGESQTAEIELDVYTNTGIFLGEEDRPINPDRIGSYTASLQKNYYTQIPVWFDSNTLFSQYARYNRPAGEGWFDTGTIQDYRFIAKVNGDYYSNPFYISNVLYSLYGSMRISDDINMDDYVYDGKTIKLLTNKPTTAYVRGQKTYLNFLFSDPQRSIGDADNFSLRVVYNVFTAGEKYLGTVYQGERQRSGFSIVNTYVLDIDSVIDQYPQAGIVRVGLARGAAIVSNMMEFIIRPDCLHTGRWFSFLNRLGGWDSFNFDADITEEVDHTLETYTKTVTPFFSRGESIESVYQSNVSESFEIEGAPVKDDVARWLKEFASSKAILDSEGNYIILEGFTLSIDPDRKNMQRPSITYRLSEPYSNE